VSNVRLRPLMALVIIVTFVPSYLFLAAVTLRHSKELLDAAAKTPAHVSAAYYVISIAEVVVLILTSLMVLIALGIICDIVEEHDWREAFKDVPQRSRRIFSLYKSHSSRSQGEQS